MENRKIKNRKRGKATKIILAVLLTVILVAIAVCVSGFLYIRNTVDFDSDKKMFELAKGSKTTRFYFDTKNDDDGKVYMAREMESERVHSGENSIWVSLDNIPDNMKNAFIAIEDRRFYSHGGVDFLRTGKAAFNYIFHFDSRFGGSTITQQLIKNISNDKDISIKRKATEMVRAIGIENEYEKDDILELYLNIVPLSQSCVGVGSAANKYFGKDVSELTLAECAAIAAITNSPTKYDIKLHPENNEKRRKIILDKMLEYGYIGQDEHDAAVKENVTVTEKMTADTDGYTSWYTDMVIGDVIKDLEENLGYSHALAVKMVYSGGLKIYTLMDKEVQDTLENYFTNEDNFQLAKENQGLKYAMVVTNPYNGAVLGIVGSQGKKDGNRLLNYASDAKRPIGSTIKPLSVYGPALEEGIITWASVIDDTPVKITPYGDGNYRLWPQNSPNVYSGLTDVATAVAVSKNTVAVKVFDKLGKEKSYDYLVNRLGISSIVRKDYDDNGNYLSDMSESPLALGQLSYGATLRETVGAYDACLTGKHHKSRSYLAVYDNSGELLMKNADAENTVWSPQTASILTKLLEGVVSHGTANVITLKNDIDTAGKTGTSGGNLDKYFIGYTPYMCAGIWCGYADSDRPIVTKTHLNIWDTVMKKLHADYFSSNEQLKNFELAENVIQAKYCRDSGMIYSDNCVDDPRGNRCSVGYFLRGTEPKEECDRHITVEYASDGSGVVPDGSLYFGETKRVSLVKNEKRDFPTQIFITDAQYSYRSLNGTLFGGTVNEPFFIKAVPIGRYIGISRGEKQFNRLARSGDGDEEDEKSEDGEDAGNGNESEEEDDITEELRGQ